MTDRANDSIILYMDSMIPTVTGATDGRFTKAMRFVVECHAGLLSLVPAIHFVPCDGAKTKHGQFSTRTREINIWGEPVSEGAGRYVETLVHELTHAKQHVEGRAYSEYEAKAAGKAARRAFLGWSRRRDFAKFGH